MSAQPGPSQPSIALAQLVDYLDQLLEVDAWEDYGPNGLQVEGRREVSSVVAGVSACGELFAHAEKVGADAVLVHHGLFWKNRPPTLTGIQLQRVAALIRAELSLLAYHLPLDAHPVLGNNAQALHALGLGSPTPFGTLAGRAIGFSGRYAEPLRASEFFDLCAAAFDREPLVLGAGPGSVTSVAVVSGGGQDLLDQALACGVDAFVTGEASEWVTNLAREGGIHYVAAGHHATERLGVRALGAHLEAEVGVSVTFVDVPNPV